MKTPSIKEKKAIAQLKQGELSGLEFLVEANQRKAIYAAYGIVRDGKMAEDVVQNAFIQAAERINQFDDQKPFEPWFLRIVINSAIRVVQRESKMIPMENLEEGTLCKVAAWLVDDTPGPEEIVERKDLCKQIWEAMKQLTGEQRAVIIMRYFLEMDEGEIISTLKRPHTTIQWRLRAARYRLRETLSPFLSGIHSDKETGRKKYE